MALYFMAIKFSNEQLELKRILVPGNIPSRLYDYDIWTEL